MSGTADKDRNTAEGHRAFDLRTAFHWDCMWGDALPDFCAGIDTGSHAWRIMRAALQGDAQWMRSLLNAPGALPDFASDCGFTPLMAAAALGRDEVVELLAAHPLVNLRRQTSDGWTALHYAAQFDNAEAARILMAHQAPVTLVTSEGKMPVDLASNAAATQAFWNNAEFVRQMKWHRPELSAPQAPPAAPPAAAAPPPEPDALKDAFFKGVANVGLQWRALDVQGALIDKLAAMDVASFRDTYKAIRAARTEFNWSGVFVAAAGRGNTAVMRFLHDDILFDQHTLNRALSAVVAAGDLRDAAHHLALWGANPDAPYEMGGVMVAPSVFDGVISGQRYGIAEELAQWSFDSIKPDQIERLKRTTPYTQAHHASEIYRMRHEMKKLRGSKLCAAFNKALETADIKGVMAGYAEARRDRFLRGNVELTKAAGGGALALALRYDKFEFARLLVSDGHSLAHASARLREDLRRHGSEAAQQFAADQLAGKLKVPNVTDVGRARRAEIRVLSMPRPGHYGMF